MLIIAKKADGRILAKWDAWYYYAEDEAIAFVKENKLTVLDDEITFSGNRIVWVA